MWVTTVIASNAIEHEVAADCIETVAKRTSLPMLTQEGIVLLPVELAPDWGIDKLVRELLTKK